MSPADRTPPIPEAVTLALALMESGKLNAAVELLNDHLRISPDCESAFCVRGSARRGLNCLDEAIADFEAALTIRPNYARAYFNRGLTRLDQKNPEAAFADFSQAVAIEPEADFFFYWGERLLQLGQYADAVDGLSECSRRGNERSACYFRLITNRLANRPEVVATSSHIWRTNRKRSRLRSLPNSGRRL